MSDTATQTETLEDRKQKEIEWADFRRTIDADDKEKVEKYHANLKYYSVNRKVNAFIENWIRTNTVGKDVLELACGNAGMVRMCSDVCKSAMAADIAPESIQQAIETAKGNPHHEKINYRVMDCEKLDLPDNSMDVLIEGGALHHMDLDVVYKEAARVLRPGGKFLCIEAIRHNPIIHTYRKLTPHLRTAWEVDHILGRKQVMQGLEHFEKIEKTHFHITTILAVPLRKTPVFKPLLGALEAVDSVLTKIPGFRWMAWQCVFVLSNPKK